MTGQTLSHYQIQEKLGEGGMGVVYKALDTHLNRPVALKLLPADKMSNPERRKRFVQEARAASALNHPHIVTIYDIASHNGNDFISMEFIQGKTLDQLQHRKHLSLVDTLKYSVQVADALAKAHTAGIVHRDLKPSNIMVTEDGRVKVLDFGLAKLVEPDHLDADASTRTLQDAAPKTDEGAIVGTAAYMSPEQAEGKNLDGRSDIFSFGSVLYEMSTGRRAFQGETKLSTLSAILREEPKLASELVPAVPRDLEKIIQRCLRKDPERRYQSMKDVRIALEELKEESDSGHLSAVPQLPRSSRRWLLGAAAALLLLGTGGAALWWRLRSAPAALEWRLRPVTADSGLTTTPALSPDGKLVAYASDRASNGTNLDLWVQPMTEGSQALRLTQNLADDLSPSFSPDGGQIAFFSSRDGGGIYLIPALGGQERLLVRGGRYPRFSPDGRWIAYSSGTKSNLAESKTFILPAGGGSPTRIADDIPWSGGPVWSPDGRRLLVLGAARTNDPGSLEFWLVSPEGGTSVKTGLVSFLRTQDISLFVEGLLLFSLDWIGDALFFGSDSSIWTIGLRNGPPQPGDLRKLVSSTTQMVDVRGSASKLVFESRSLPFHLWSLPLDLNAGKVRGALEPLPHAGGSQTMPASSSDGRRLVYLQKGPSSEEVRLRNMSSGTETVLTTGNARPKLAPDGAKLAYSTSQSATRGALFMMDSSGGEAAKLLDPPGGVTIYGWSADGKRIVYWDGTPVRFSVFDLEKHQASELISHPTYNIHGAELSPDGKWVAFHLPRPGSETVSIAPVREGKAAAEAEWITVAAVAGSNRRPWWSSDGNLLYFLSTRDNYQCIWAQRLDPATKAPRGEPMAVYHFHETRRSLNILASATFGPAVGGGRIVFALGERAGNIWLAEPAAAAR